MNERINILAEQAGLHCNGTPDCWDQEAIARFTELIVRECVQVAGDNATATKNPNIGMAKLEVVRAIIKHFGVEK